MIKKTHKHYKLIIKHTFKEKIILREHSLNFLFENDVTHNSLIILWIQHLIRKWLIMTQEMYCDLTLVVG